MQITEVTNRTDCTRVNAITHVSTRAVFYVLLREQLGLTRQTALIRVNEVLELTAQAPLILERSARELVEALHFIKVTVFKKGVIFVTVLENTSFEQALSASKGYKGNKASSSSKPGKVGAKHTVRKAKSTIQAL